MKSCSTGHRARQVISGLAAVALMAATALSATAAEAASAPQPRKEQWWFKAWEIQGKVWPHSKGKGVKVAVIDTGVNASLPDLRGAVIPGKDFRTGKGDGRVDRDSKDFGIIGGDGSGHGTGMASLIAGQGKGIGFVGVAPEAKILPIVHDGTLPGFVREINYAADQGASVINLSQAQPASAAVGCPLQLQQAIDAAIKKGSVVVASAGNDGSGRNDAMIPAVCAGVLAVGAADNKKGAWKNTQRQSYVAVAAPGVAVRTLRKNGKLDPTWISGTSQAAALASAAVALVRSRSPQLGPREVVQRMINTSIDVGDKGIDDATGKGVIFPQFALTNQVSPSAPNPPFERLDKWRGKQSGTQSKSPGAAKKNDDESNSGLMAAAAVVAVLVIVAGVVVAFLLMRRKPRSGAMHEAYAPHPGQAPWPPNQGPPPGQAPWPPNQAPPPGGGSRPSFRPPEQ